MSHLSLPSISYHSLILNEFYLTPSLAATLDEYYMMKWDGSYFKSQVTCAGTIVHRGVEYVLVLPTTLYIRFFESTKVKLSFRKAKPGYPGSEFPYVLVRFA